LIHITLVCAKKFVAAVSGWRYDRAANARKHEMSKQSLRDETERLVKEALERKTLTIKQGQTRIETRCGKCGAPNRVSADPGQVRVPYTCKECGEKQRTF
jgi:hypothetical protein